MNNVPKAKLHWKRRPLAMKTRARGICARNNITEATLNVPEACGRCSPTRMFVSSSKLF